MNDPKEVIKLARRLHDMDKDFTARDVLEKEYHISKRSMKNLTYSELIKIAPTDRPFQIEVESNPDGEGGRQMLWGRIQNGNLLNTYGYGQCDIDGINYGWTSHWEDYKGNFTLIDSRYQKPEVLKVGQKVRIMESLRECEEFQSWNEDCKSQVGKEGTIFDVQDTPQGVYYRVDSGYTLYTYPHYAVMPVEEEEETKEIPELKGTIDQLSMLIGQAQEIVDKYKK